MPRTKPTNVEALFWRNARPTGDGSCWEWAGAHDKNGYAVTTVWESGKIKGLRMHRVSHAMFRGDPGRLLVCHHCDNPGCINPAHLFLGTQTDNMKDCTSKQRQAKGLALSESQKLGWGRRQTPVGT